ncbi:hypothetical protein QBC39DRAFT_385416 [Podospora conica]|nr:hypothetical protein QBC39DRAFT_385416 [Schizothecium conicum]
MGRQSAQRIDQESSNDMTNQAAADLIARSNRLGADPKNTNYAGGNTSAKGIEIDPVTGEPIELMWVKGSGGDLGTPTESGLAVLRVDRLRALKDVYPGLGREDEMVAAFDYTLHGKGGAAPSIDTAMHGLVDAAHVDHLHPDSGIAIATAADGEELTATIFGDKVVRVPWRRPVFQLGLDIAAIKEVNPAAIGCILGGHGITAWGDTSDEAEANSLWIIETASAYIEANSKAEPFGPALDGIPRAARGRAPRQGGGPGPRHPRPRLQWPSTDKPMVGHFTDSAEVLDFLAASQHPRLTALGTSCPDHFLRTKVKPMVGIGKVIAVRLASEGACVVIADLDLAKAQAAAAELGSTDVAIGMAADVSNEAAVIAAIDAAVFAFGGLDLVVNNAGLSLSRPLLETTEADWDLQHNVMAKGSFLVSKNAARVLIAQKLGGDIVYISSKNSVFAGPNNVAYSATKADQAHQVRLLAAELGEHRIKVNGINPDGVVRGSGIFASGWGANRAATYGIEEEDLMRGERMLGVPFHYRDERTARGVDAVHGLVSPAELYARNGLQFLPFNSLYQLAVDREDGVLQLVAERSNASTTGLLSVTDGTWDAELLARLGLPASVLPPLVEAGSRIGSLLPQVAAELGAPGPVDVIAVASHDTASAVLAVPMQAERSAYISCGTWGLVGLELDQPVLSDAAREANFTNEGGVDGTVRFLHNVMGLWLLSESIRSWEKQDGASIALVPLLEAAAAVNSPVAVFDADDARFMAPGDLPARIAEYCVEHGLAVPEGRAQMVRSIIESLAEAFADTVRTAQRLADRSVDVLHIVGGGSQNELLCQLTADRLGVPVLAGPVEATAIGNVLVQARAQGLVSGGLAELREIVVANVQPRRHEPRSAR